MTQFQKSHLLRNAIQAALNSTMKTAYDSGIADATASQSPDTHTDSDAAHYANCSGEANLNAYLTILDAVLTYETA